MKNFFFLSPPHKEEKNSLAKLVNLLVGVGGLGINILFQLPYSPGQHIDHM